MVTRIDNGECFLEVGSLPVDHQLRLQGQGIDRSKLKDLYVCCYNYRQHIETKYYNLLLKLWKEETL